MTYNSREISFFKPTSLAKNTMLTHKIGLKVNYICNVVVYSAWSLNRQRIIIHSLIAGIVSKKESKIKYTVKSLEFDKTNQEL